MSSTSSNNKQSLKASDYTVGWICALPLELAAATVLLDEEHGDLPQQHSDLNTYTLGRMGEHNVVLACLPGGEIGIASAAATATSMAGHFENLRFGLMVGVGGGVPNEHQDIRLGDVVISKPMDRHGGVIQYDFGRTGEDGKIARDGWLNAPPAVLRTAAAKLDTRQLIQKLDLKPHLASFDTLERFRFPGAERDILYKASYRHVSGTNCVHCSKEEVIQREERQNSEPVLHFGTIASANQVMKDAETRDEWCEELDGVLCFEMEAAGLMNTFPCLVIRGICDYSDSHKNYLWQPYAAAAAAAVAKELLSTIPSNRVLEIQKIIDNNSINRNEGSNVGLTQGHGMLNHGSVGQGGVVQLFGSATYSGRTNIGGYNNHN